MPKAAEHLSLYQLTIEPETPFEALFKRRQLKIPDRRTGPRALGRDAGALRRGRDCPLTKFPTTRAPGAECRHNLVYWRYGEYVGVGPGAHGRIGIGDQRRATMTEKHPERWLAQVESGGHGLIVDEPLRREGAGRRISADGAAPSPRASISSRYQALSGQPLDPAQIMLCKSMD